MTSNVAAVVFSLSNSMIAARSVHTLPGPVLAQVPLPRLPGACGASAAPATGVNVWEGGFGVCGVFGWLDRKVTAGLVVVAWTLAGFLTGPLAAAPVRLLWPTNIAAIGATRNAAAATPR